MDPGKEEQEYPQGLLGLLEQLEQRQRGRALQQQQLQHRAQFLQGKIRELRHRRDRIREKLDMAEQGILGNSGIWDPREVLGWKIRECRQRLRLFQLTGLSMSLCPGAVSVSLHSSFEGSLLDSFHLQLQPFPGNSRESRGFRLRRHSIPPFIPLESLSREFLPQKPREFLGMLARHLSAFLARRHQLQLLQEEFGPWLRGVPSGNSLCNLLSFQYRIPTENSRKNPGKNPGENSEENSGKNSEEFREFRARLQYRDPLRSLPSNVSVTTEEGVPVPEHSELLRSRSLTRAMREILA